MVALLAGNVGIPTFINWDGFKQLTVVIKPTTTASIVGITGTIPN